MKRIALLILAVLVAGSFFACSGDDGAAGVNGTPGTPQPIKIVALGSDSGGTQTFTYQLNATGKFPPGSTINYIDVLDSIPPVSELKKYHCAIIYTNSAPVDPAGLGDRLADYVDAGGKLVVLQACLSNPYSLAGRIMTANYSPLTPAGAAGDVTDKTLDLSTIAFPIHPIFVGIDLQAYSRPGNSNYSIPDVDPNAAVMAQFNGALVAVAMNAGKSIIAINDFPGLAGQSVLPLAANCAMYLSGKF